ncbi:site-specific DNA-methyltransferase [Pseudoalteromonas sp. S2755]|uniref:DNA-methyltransferase n=1 Tax=Pseudoalteromonas sp. S2755 TaxID=2066523 RepID=UPI00110AC672|nr:site-specific DNA-methyltransferase [Pseudoalteromonas sp. S2755]TMN34125.1 hypothetical protein CWC03_17190 [Pseudoalteromonas sp. S2755]
MTKVSIINGDCVEESKNIPDNLVDLVLTDPPYLIGASSIGKPSRTGSWADWMNVAHFYKSWFEQAKRILKDTGYLVSFCNWRSMPVITKALADIGLSITSVLVWDKQCLGTGPKKALRPRYELVVFVGMKDAEIPNRSLSDIWECKKVAPQNRVTGHPAEKPVQLFEKLICETTQEGSLVVDFFTGSGTAGVACQNTGRSFIGYELDPKWHQAALKRINR